MITYVYSRQRVGTDFLFGLTHSWDKGLPIHSLNDVIPRFAARILENQHNNLERPIIMGSNNSELHKENSMRFFSPRSVVFFRRIRLGELNIKVNPVLTRLIIGMWSANSAFSRLAQKVESRISSYRWRTAFDT